MRDLVRATVDLSRALRERGVAVTAAESIDAVAALDHIDLADREEVRRALGIVLASRREDLPVIDELFDLLWSAPMPAAAGAPPAPRMIARVPRPPAPALPAASLWMDRWARADRADEDGDPIRLRAPGDRAGMRRRDFAAFARDDLSEMLRVARRLARRLARRASRRWRPSHRGTAIDQRRTVRWSMRTGGEAIELARRERRIRRAKLTVICDVSGSMELYGRFLLHFLYAMQNAFTRVESFVFATRLRRVTRELHGREWMQALDRLAEEVDDWSGGTRIGGSIAELVRQWPQVIDRHTIVVMLSDGWDAGEPAQLAGALAELRARAGRVIWLNPLLGSPDYRPLARGMQAALPHVDVFAPAHDLASLEALARHLVLRSGR